MKKRAAAFTIMEVSVAMLLAAIVIGITYTAYSIINYSYLSFHKKNEAMAVLMRADELLSRDFAKADTIMRDEKGLVFYTASEVIRYEIDSANIVRTSAITDTFKVKTAAVNYLFENQPITEVSPVQEQNRVDELQLTLFFQEQKIPYYYHKLYSSANLIERNPNAIH